MRRTLWGWLNMSSHDNEEELLRSVALQNARTILLARERAEKSLLQAKLELERKNKDLFEQREWFKVTLSSIGDGVITIDSQGNLTFLNPVAEALTGWKAREAIGMPLETVFVLLNEHTRLPAENPALKALRGGIVVSLANNTILVRRDGTSVPIEDSAAPICNFEGEISGAVMVFHDVTDRRQRDATLARLAAVIESSDDAILSMSLDAIITTWNAGAERMYGYTAREIVGKSVNILIPPGRADEEPGILERLTKGERIDHYETMRRARDGTDLHVSLTVSPIIDSTGRIIGASKISRDISRRKRDEERLRRSEEDLRALADSIPQLAWMAKPDGHIFWYNRRWLDYTGATFEQMEGWGWQSVHDPKLLPQVMERWQESLRTGAPFNMEFPLRRADGRFRWFLTRVNPLRDHQGRVVRWFGTNTDVDEVRGAQEALREETSVLELLNDTGTAIAANLDLETLVQTVTDAGTKLSGAQFGAFFHNVINAEGESYLLYTLSGARPEAFEKFGMPRNTPVFNTTFSGQGVVRSDDITKDPRYGTMPPHHGMPRGHLPVRSYLAVPVISRSGNVIGGLFFGHAETGVFSERSERLILGVAAQAAIAIDNARLYEAAQKELAERKRSDDALRHAQERLSQYAEELERQVAQRTAALRDKIAELEAFSYSISHDLRAPLRAIQSYSLILDEEAGPRLSTAEKAYLRRMASAAGRMDLLIQDVLTYSRLARMAVALKPIDLGELLRGIVESYPSFQPPSAIIELIEPFPLVMGADALLTQCVSNILGNAVKFVAPGVTPRARVWAETQPGGETAKLFFKDNGLGIPAEAHQRIFGIFERISNDYEGTGIGLSIVKKGVDLLGGSVGLESEPGKGTTFWLQLNRPRPAHA